MHHHNPWRRGNTLEYRSKIIWKEGLFGSVGDQGAESINVSFSTVECASTANRVQRLQGGATASPLNLTGSGYNALEPKQTWLVLWNKN